MVGRPRRKTFTCRVFRFEDEANELLLSVASVWEMQIKIQLGKLQLSLPLKELIKNQQDTNALSVSPVTPTQVWHHTRYLFITKIHSIVCRLLKVLKKTLL